MFLVFSFYFLASSVRRQTDVGEFAFKILEIAGDAYHGGIVGAEFERRDERLPVVLLADTLQFTSKQTVGADAASDGHLPHFVVDGGALYLLNQEFYDGLLDAGAEVSLVFFYEVGVFFQPVAEEIEE